MSPRHLLPMAIIVSLLPLPAAAHAILVASQPAAGSTIPAGKTTFQLHYNSRIDRVRSRLTVMRPDHTQATLPIAATGGLDELDASVSLTAGAYVLRWQVLAIDGHITRGDVNFNVSP